MTSDAKEIGSLIKTMSTNGCKQIDQDLMKKVKNYCKNGDEFVEQVFRMILIQLETPHSQIRYSLLLIIDELFRRSHHFRSLMLKNDNLQKFFDLSLGINEDHPIPPPKKFKHELIKKSIELIDNWNHKYSNGYPSLKSAYNHLKSSRVNFTERQVVRETERQAKKVEENMKNQLLKEKILKVTKAFDELKNECDCILIQADNCFNLLYPNIVNDEQICDNQDVYDRYASNTFNHDINVTVQSQVEITKGPDNESLIESMKDIYKQIVTHYLPKLKGILKEMSKGSEYCSDDIKKAIDLKCQLIQIIQKYFEMKIIDSADSGEKQKNETSESEDSDFEEVPEKELELIIPQHRWKEYGLLEPNNSSNEASTSSGSSSRMCKFPLQNGKLCPRKDKIKCPFHGKIIDRNEVGMPLNQKDYERETREAEKARVEEWQNPIFLKEIEAQTGIDLTLTRKGKSKSCKRKESLLQDLKTCDQTPRDRLYKKIFTKKAQQRAVDSLNTEDEHLHSHFEDQWNYAMKT